MNRALICVLLVASVFNLSRPAFSQGGPVTVQMELPDEALPDDQEFTEPPSETYLMWMIGCLGWRYTFPLPLAALASFLISATLLSRGKGESPGAALAFLVAIPALIGLVGMFDGILTSMMVISTSTGIPRPSEVAAGVGTALVCPLVGLVLTSPAYLLVTIGLATRAMRRDPSDWPWPSELLT